MPTISFSVDSATAARIARAVGNRMYLLDDTGVPRNATPAEIKQFLITYLTTQVHDAEVSIEQAKIDVIDISAT